MHVNRPGGKLSRDMGKGYLVAKKSDVEPRKSVCGESWRVLTRRETEKVSLHVVRIREATRHYHANCTELYYVLEGSGLLEVGGDEVRLEVGTLVMIEAGTPHAGRGDFTAIVAAVPAWDEADEHPA